MSRLRVVMTDPVASSCRIKTIKRPDVIEALNTGITQGLDANLALRSTPASDGRQEVDLTVRIDPLHQAQLAGIAIYDCRDSG